MSSKIIKALKDLEQRLHKMSDQELSSVIDSSGLDPKESKFLENIIKALDDNFKNSFEDKVKLIKEFSREEILEIIDPKEVSPEDRSKAIDILDEIIFLENRGDDKISIRRVCLWKKRLFMDT